MSHLNDKQWLVDVCGGEAQRPTELAHLRAILSSTVVVLSGRQTRPADHLRVLIIRNSLEWAVERLFELIHLIPRGIRAKQNPSG